MHRLAWSPNSCLVIDGFHNALSNLAKPAITASLNRAPVYSSLQTKLIPQLAVSRNWPRASPRSHRCPSKIGLSGSPLSIVIQYRIQVCRRRAMAPLTWIVRPLSTQLGPLLSINLSLPVSPRRYRHFVPGYIVVPYLRKWAAKALQQAVVEALEIWSTA